ncbi:MAG: hypothetical protein HQL31_04405, partial [Planctomycetes bacterium]|nr:hypothetical protein [Planctomycetota bacterium]
MSRSSLFVLIFSLLASLGQAATITWTGTASDDWETPANWDLGVPAAGDSVVIATGAVRYPNISSSPATFQDLTISYGNLAIRDDVTLTGNLVSSGNITIYNSPVISLGGNLQFSSTAGFTRNTETIAFSGTSGNQDFYSGSKTFYNLSVQTGGNVVLQENVSQIDLGATLSITSGSLDLNGNTFALASQLTLAGGNLLVGSGNLDAGTTKGIRVRAGGNLSIAAGGNIRCGFFTVDQTGQFTSLSGTPSIHVYGTLNLSSASYTPGTSQIFMKGTGDVDVSRDLYDLIVDGGSVTLNQALNIDNSLSIINNGVLDLNTKTLSAYNDLSIANGGNLLVGSGTVTGESGSVNLSVGGGLSVSVGIIQGNNLTTTPGGNFKSSGTSTITLVGNLDVQDGAKWSLGSGELAMTHGNVNVSSGNSIGDFSVLGNVTLVGNHLAQTQAASLTILATGNLDLNAFRFTLGADFNHTAGVLTISNGNLFSNNNDLDI